MAEPKAKKRKQKSKSKRPLRAKPASVARQDEVRSGTQIPVGYPGYVEPVAREGAWREEPSDQEEVSEHDFGAAAPIAPDERDDTYK